MEVVVLVIHLFIALAMIGMILLQRSEGGALGIGGGGTAGGLFSARGAANALTRTTAILAAAFFATSILLTFLANANVKPSSIITPPPVSAPAAPATPLPTEPGAPASQPATPPAQPAGSGPAVPAPTQPSTPPAEQPATPPADKPKTP